MTIIIRPRVRGSGKIFEWMTFLPVQPFYTEPCKFCYRLQYYLPFINLYGSTSVV